MQDVGRSRTVGCGYSRTGDRGQQEFGPRQSGIRAVATREPSRGKRVTGSVGTSREYVSRRQVRALMWSERLPRCSLPRFSLPRTFPKDYNPYCHCSA